MEASSRRPRVFSGVQPTGVLHIGSYVGALRQWVAGQDERDNIFCVVDLHALTIPEAVDPQQLRERVRSTAAQFLAAGVDPEKSVIFVQSHVREHSELSWLLSCLTPLGWLYRMTQFKSKSEGRESVGTGLLVYPVLQAADILLYTPGPGEGAAGRVLRVPVGEDQRQHLELTRTLAQRFNQRFGETFAIPEAYIPEGAAKITDLQEPTAKMSKSASSPQGIIDVLEEPGPMRKKIMRAVTDTGTEVRYDEENKAGITNLLRIYSALSGTAVPELEQRYAGSGYGQFKKDLAQLVVDTFTPIRERTHKLLADEDRLDRILADGAARAREAAERTMEVVRDRVGFVGRDH